MKSLRTRTPSIERSLFALTLIAGLGLASAAQAQQAQASGSVDPGHLAAPAASDTTPATPASAPLPPLPPLPQAAPQSSPAPAAPAPEVPAAPAPPAAPPGQVATRPNIGMLVGGTVATAAGAVLLLFGGASMALSGRSSTTVCGEHSGCHVEVLTDSDRATYRTLGWVGLVSGVALAAGGITLIVVGARRRPVPPGTARSTLELGATPGAAFVRVTF